MSIRNAGQERRSGTDLDVRVSPALDQRNNNAEAQQPQRSLPCNIPPAFLLALARRFWVDQWLW